MGCKLFCGHLGNNIMVVGCPDCVWYNVFIAMAHHRHGLLQPHEVAKGVALKSKAMSYAKPCIRLRSLYLVPCLFLGLARREVSTSLRSPSASAIRLRRVSNSANSLARFSSAAISSDLDLDVLPL